MRKSLEESEIVRIIKEYIENKDENYAIMIDGEWGSGKTYFIKNKIMKMYHEEENKRRFIYVSTYGIKAASELDDRIYDSMIIEFLPQKTKKVYKIAEKGLSSIYKIIKIFKELPDIPKSSIRNLIEIIQKQKEKEYILIFDDIERCDMQINELLGYINTFVEQRLMKVIIIANEKELSKKKIYSNLELKYIVAKDTNINIPIKKNEDVFSFYNENRNNKQNVEKLELEDLDKRTDTIFGQDVLYKQVKEKLIGMTIYYCPDLQEVIESLINKQISDLSIKNYLIDKSDRIIEILRNKNHINIRTLKFVLWKLEKIFSIVLKMDLSQYESKLFDECKYQLLSYITYKCIEYKEGKDNARWLEKTEIEHTGVEMFNEYITSFKFVDDIIASGSFDKEKIEEVITLYVKEKSEKSVDYSEPIKKLEGYWELEDTVIEENISLVMEKLERDGYDKKLYSRIILILLKIVNIGFNENILNNAINIMKRNIINSGFYDELDEFSLVFTDSKEADEFNRVIKPIKDIIAETKNIEKEDSINSVINIKEGWGNEFVQYVRRNKDKFLTKKEFFALINIDNLINVIKQSSVKDISDFRRILGSQYGFNNIKEYYITDIKNLNESVNKLIDIDEKEMDSYDKAKKYNINLLKEKLEEIIKRLE